MKTRRSKRKVEVNQIPIPINIIEAETQCLHCTAEFLDEEDLKMHIEQVHSRGIVLCKFCSANLSGPDEYVTHFISSHLERALICYYCHRAFLSGAAFKQHELKHCAVEDEPLSCSHCTQMFASRNELQSHEFKLHKDSGEGVLLNDLYSLLSSALNMQVTKFLDAVANNKPVFCLMCNHYSTSIIDYVDHLNTANCKSFACDKCFRIYKKKDGVFRHIKSQPKCRNISKVVTQQCYKCKKVFDQKEIDEHKESCTAQICKTCGVICMSIYELAEHKVVKHKVTQSITLVVCTFCKREFVGEACLKKHIDRVHKNGHHYVYACAYCDDRFAHPKRLFAHFFTKHKEIYPYTCKICNIKFRIRKKFTIHIKLDHKSNGFVEFDQNLHVIFTDKKSQNPILPAIPDGFGCDTDKSSKSSEGSNEKEAINVEETTDKAEPKPIEETNDTDNTQNNKTINPVTTANHNVDLHTNSEECEEVGINNEPSDSKTEDNLKKHRKKGVMQKSPQKKARKADIDSDISEDEPLIKMKNRANNKNFSKPRSRRRGRRNTKNQTAKLTCKICNKYCYTFQNYHHHMSLHEQSMLKRCIKCLEYFKSKEELEDHINKAHSTSKLTETLKSLLERRKQNQTVKENSNLRPAETLRSVLEKRKKAQLMNAHNSLVNKFKRTIKKVNVSDDTSVTITPMTEHGLSVKRYIENFRPDVADGVNICSSITFNALTTPVERPPLIKLKKFSEEEESTIYTGRLRFPVKFKDCTTDTQSNVTVKLVQELLTKPRSLNFLYDERIPTISPTPDKEENSDYCNTFADDTDYTQYKNDTTIPEVAHEVMLGEADDVPKTRQLAQEIIIPNISEEHGGVRIGHLTSKAPFYKIVQVKELLKPPEPEKPKKEQDSKKEIELPDGMHLVTVKNPYSHLIPNDDLQKVVKAQKNKYYTPKVKNIQAAFIQALRNLNKPRKPRPSRRKKKEKNAKSETELSSSFETVDNNQLVEGMELSQFDTLESSIDADQALETMELSLTQTSQSNELND